MKKILGTIILLGLVGCGEPLMPEEYSSLVLGTSEFEVRKEMGLPYRPISDDGEYKVFKKTLEQDPLFEGILLSFRQGRLDDLAFIVKQSRCSRDLYHGLVRAMTEKLGCKAKFEKQGEAHQADWTSCLEGRPSPSPTSIYLVHQDQGGCMTVLRYVTERSEDWTPAGERVDL